MPRKSKGPRHELTTEDRRRAAQVTNRLRWGDKTPEQISDAMRRMVQIRYAKKKAKAKRGAAA